MLEFSYQPQISYGFYKGVAGATELLENGTGMLMFLCYETSTFGNSITRVIWKIACIRNETESISVRVKQLLGILNFILKLLSKLIFFAHNLLDVSI